MPELAFEGDPGLAALGRELAAHSPAFSGILSDPAFNNYYAISFGWIDGAYGAAPAQSGPERTERGEAWAIDINRNSLAKSMGRVFSLEETIAHEALHAVVKSRPGYFYDSKVERVIEERVNDVRRDLGLPPADSVVYSRAYRYNDAKHPTQDRDHYSVLAPGEFCFAHGTPVLLASGVLCAIESVGPGDKVLAFDPAALDGRGGLTPKSVVRVFRSITETWIRLSNGLTVTPGHRFLDARGGFRSIEQILQTDGIIILENGSGAEVTGEYVRYSEGTAHLFEEAEGYSTQRVGGLALAPVYRKGWRTYNFEVEDLHTYVAGGVRVHNDSYAIQKGDTLSEIAARNNTTVSDIMSRNPHIRDADVIYAGTKIHFEPNTGRSVPGSPSSSYSSGNYTIASGDTLSGIAANTGTTVSALMAANPHISNPDRIYAGDRISVPGGSSQQSSGGGSSHNSSGGYTISSGDTLSGIAASTGTTVSALMGANPQISNPDRINAGDTISIPGKTSVVSSYSSPDGGGKASQNDHSSSPSSSSSASKSSSSSKGESSSKPVLLDLDGDGIEITQFSSSNMFFDVAGDGKQHRTAWAGAGDGVLVRDAGNDGIIKERNELDFTEWDATARSDMEALRNVFDTNHDGLLDANDADWSLFKVLVTNTDGTTTLRTLAELGITSIGLVTNNQEVVLSDGSQIKGTTVFTRSDGSTGTAADVELVFDADGFVVDRTVTANADGSTTIVNTASSENGSLANITRSTTSADGLTITLEFDDDGDGVHDRVQTDVTVIHGDGFVTGRNGERARHSRLSRRTAQRLRAGSRSTTVLRDNGSSPRAGLRGRESVEHELSVRRMGAGRPTDDKTDLIWASWNASTTEDRQLLRNRV